MSKTIVLGGGLAGLSFSSFLGTPSIVIEKQKAVGGMCRSFKLDGIDYDLGPHIIFSKNKEVLDLHTSIIETNKIKRFNQILYHGCRVKYPFENDLGKLPKHDRDYCLQEFLSNPYEEYTPQNMLQFFLKTFGEGITRLYLQPYNEKIWKFDPSCMDTQMVERIPKPPKEDVVASANGVETEGYVHQLYFHYPKTGGFQSLVDAYAKRATDKGSEIRTGVEIKSLARGNEDWTVSTDQGEIKASQLVNCMPLHELFTYLDAPAEVKTALAALKYNAIHIVALHVKKDAIGNHFAFYVPDQDVIFHRLSKVNFLGEAYCRSGEESTLMAEVTFRPGSWIGSLSVEEIQSRVIKGLASLGLVDPADVLAIETRTEKYAYVIYDLDHRKNVDCVLSYLKSIGIQCVGRFAEFEYLNSDAVVEHTLKLARQMNKAEAA